MGGPATVSPPTKSSAPATSSKPAGPSLKKQWDLTDPPPLDSGTNEKAKKLVADFKAAMEPVKQCLLYTKVNAEKPKHDAMINKRDPLYAEFPSKLGEVNQDESKADAISKPFLDRARALSGEANKLKQETEKSLKAWQAKEPAYTKSEQQIEELEKWKAEDDGYKTLRKSADDVRSATNDNKYDEAVKRLTQLQTNLKPVYDAYEKQKAAKAIYDTNWNSLKPRLEKSLAEKTEGDKTKATQWEISNSRLDMEHVASQKDYINANTRLDKLPALIDRFDKEYKEEKSSVKFFKPKFSVAETSFEAEMNVEKEFLVQFENAADLAKDAKFTFEWEEPAKPAPEIKMPAPAVPGASSGPAPKVEIPVARLGEVATKQSTGSYKVKTGMPGSQTLKYFVSAKQGSDAARWEVPQTTSVNVKAPEVKVSADAGKKFKPKDTTTIKVEFKNVNKAKELVGNYLTCKMEAESVRSLDNAGGDQGTPAGFRDPFNKVKEGWTGDNTYEVTLKADHAGATTARIEITHPCFTKVKPDAPKFECISKFADFVKALDGTSEAVEKIAGHVSNYLGTIIRMMQTAHQAHEATIKAENEKKPSVGGVVVETVWKTVSEAEVHLKTIAKVGEIVAKLAEASAVEPTAEKLSKLSSEKLASTIVIKAASYQGYEPTVANLPIIQTELTNKLRMTMADTIRTWRNWASDAANTSNEKATPFDPSDALYQSAVVGGTRLANLPIDAVHVDDYEREFWKVWVKNNPNYFKWHSNLTKSRDALGPITPIRSRLTRLGVDYPK
jgi:hypothetical protein